METKTTTINIDLDLGDAIKRMARWAKLTTMSYRHW